MSALALDISSAHKVCRVLSDMLAQYRGPRSRTSLEATSGAPEDDNAPPVLVLPSSTELFYFYAQTLDQCAQLFTGQPLYDLCTLFKKWLRIYAGMFYTGACRLVLNTAGFQRRCWWQA